MRFLWLLLRRSCYAFPDSRLPVLPYGGFYGVSDCWRLFRDVQLRLLSAPCVPANLAAKPTKGYCNFAMVFQIQNGTFDNVKLDGLAFAAIGRAPEIIGQRELVRGINHR